MIAAARWIQQHATKFGGNPQHIVINGDSSGGNAIDELLAANNGTGFPDLFVGAIAESTGWGSEGTSADRDSALQNNIQATGCAAAADPIDCMRQMPIGEFQARITKDGFGPTVDGSFIVAPHYQMFEQGRFQNIPVIYGYASDEATPDFISNQTINTTAELAADIQNSVGKSLTDAELASVIAMYPESLNNVSIFGRDMNPRNASLRQGSGIEWQRGAAVKTELKLHCVGAFFSDMFASVGQAANYAYRYNILDETPGGNADKGLFSPHTSELYAVWGANNTDGGDPGCLTLPPADPLSCAAGASITQQYWISFVRTLDPNALRAPGSPEWTPWSVAAPNRIVLDNAGAAMEQMGAAAGEVPLAGVNQRQRCLGMVTGLAKRINQGLGEGGTLLPFANGTRVDPTLAVLQQGAAAAVPAVVVPAASPAVAVAPSSPCGGGGRGGGAAAAVAPVASGMAAPAPASNIVGGGAAAVVPQPALSGVAPSAAPGAGPGGSSGPVSVLSSDATGRTFYANLGNGSLGTNGTYLNGTRPTIGENGAPGVFAPRVMSLAAVFLGATLMNI